MTDLSKEELDRLLDPRKMTEGGVDAAGKGQVAGS